MAYYGSHMFLIVFVSFRFFPTPRLATSNASPKWHLPQAMLDKKKNPQMPQRREEAASFEMTEMMRVTLAVDCGDSHLRTSSPVSSSWKRLTFGSSGRKR